MAQFRSTYVPTRTWQVQGDGMTIAPRALAASFPRQPHEFEAKVKFSEGNGDRFGAPVKFGKKPVAKQPVQSPPSQVLPSMAAQLRPQAAFWTLPYIAAITPQYIETTLRGALAGNHNQACELFDLMWDSDPEIQACIGEYCDGVIAKKVQFVPYCEDDEEPTPSAVEKCKLVAAALRSMRPDAASDENDLKGTIKDLLAARFHGQSVLEIDWETFPGSGAMNLKTIPGISGQVTCPRATYWVHPRCYGWNMATKPEGMIAGTLGLKVQKQAQRNATNWQRPIIDPSAFSTIVPTNNAAVEPFPANKFLIGIHKGKTGSPLGASCLRSLAMWWFYSNFCGDLLLNACQLFGVPFRVAHMAPGATPQDWADVRQMLQSAGAAGYVILKEGTTIEALEAGAAGSGQSPQAFLHHFADAQKRKVILRQTMSGGQHGAAVKGVTGAFGDVEADKTQQCVNAGADFACSVINLQFIPAVLELNYGKDGGDLEAPTVKLIDDDVGNLQDAQTDQIITTLIDVPDSFLRRKYRIPKAQAGEAVAGVDGGTLGAAAVAAEEAAQADRDQADAHAKLNADALAKGAVAGGPGAVPGQPGGKKGAFGAKPGQPGGTAVAKSAGEEDDAAGGAAEARRAAIEAKAAAEAKPDVAPAANALAETMAPLTARLEAITKIKDEATRGAALRKFLKDEPKLSAALAHDQSLARTITPKLVARFLDGLAKKGGTP